MPFFFDIFVDLWRSQGARGRARGGIRVNTAPMQATPEVAVHNKGPVLHGSSFICRAAVFFRKRKQLHEQLHERGVGGAMSLQLNHVLNPMRVGFQRS